MPGRFVLKIGDHLEDAETKRYYNERVFSEIAPRYDFISRVLSFGRDAAWKRTLVSLLPSHESPVCVDLACGTGDIAFLLAGKYPRARFGSHSEDFGCSVRGKEFPVRSKSDVFSRAPRKNETDTASGKIINRRVLVMAVMDAMGHGSLPVPSIASVEKR